METKKAIWGLKAEQKILAKTIRETKDAIKENFRNGEPAGHLQCAVVDYRSDYRHKHIAYCILRGTERNVIEKPAEDNLPNEARISEVINEFKA